MMTPQKKLLLKISLSFFLLAFLFFTIDVREVFAQLRKVHAGLLCLAVLLALFDRAFMGIKWNILLRAKNILRPYPFVTMLYFTGSFFSIFIPLGISGDIYRVCAVSQDKNERVHLTASVILERVIGIMCAIIMAVAGIFLFLFVLNIRVRIFVVTVIFLLLSGTFLFFLSFSKSLQHPLFFRENLLAKFGLMRTLKSIIESYQDYRSQKGALALFFILTLIEQVVPVLATFLIARSLGSELPIVTFFAVIPVTLIISKVPIAFNAIGIQDSLYVYLFSLVGILAPEAFGISLMGHFIVVLSTLPGGIAYLLRK